MKPVMYLAIATMAAGCASQPSTEYSDAYQPDEAKMAAVEHRAVQLGTRVFWVNPPRKVRQEPTS